ncbi:MAG: SRPBCC domain-containing protein [Alphaproteobacteria bacterium]|nr:SRPBCC domain-containing protein [Alphaproteobacteria bacterium]
MPDILHKVGIKSSSPAGTYKALTTGPRLAAWWTRDTQADTAVGGTIRFRFGEGGFDMKILDLAPGRHVLWEVIDGPQDWLRTKVRFDLSHDREHTVVLFKHEGWREPSEFMHHCSTKWATFLMSLKALVETGHGALWPNDVKIDEMN